MKLSKILIALFVISYGLFAKSGLELGVFVPFGVGIGVHYYNDPLSSYTKDQLSSYNKYVTNNTKTSEAGFEAGVLFQAGYRLELNGDISFSFMGEFGYSRDVFNYRGKEINKESIVLKMQQYKYYTFNSVVLGLLPRFNYKRFSLGFGFGMKIFVDGTMNDSGYNELLGYSKENIKMIDTKNYKDYFSSNIIPYIKLTFDYAVYTSKKFDFVIGAYLDYDFGLKYYEKGKKIDNKIDAPIENIASVDLGIQVGARIRPMN